MDTPDERSLMAWHYTSFVFDEKIQRSHALLPSNRLGIYKAPLLWFSANQEWEYMTAQLGDINRLFGRAHSSWQQLADLHLAVRYGLQIGDLRLLDWPATCQVAGLNRGERREREKIAKKNRSDATKWYASTQPIPLSELRKEIWYEGAWVSCEE